MYFLVIFQILHFWSLFLFAASYLLAWKYIKMSQMMAILTPEKIRIIKHVISEIYPFEWKMYFLVKKCIFWTKQKCIFWYFFYKVSIEIFGNKHLKLMISSLYASTSSKSFISHDLKTQSFNFSSKVPIFLTLLVIRKWPKNTFFLTKKYIWNLVILLWSFWSNASCI